MKDEAVKGWIQRAFEQVIFFQKGFTASVFTVSLLIVVVVLATSATQTATGAIAGKITDATMGLIPGATIVATAGEQRIRTVSNIRGEYRLDLPPGRYVVVASLAGFRPATFEANVAADRTTEWNPVLYVGTFRSRDETLAELRSFVERLTGPGWIDCGQHLITRPFVTATEEALKSSLSCGLETTRQKKSFMTLNESPAIDSYILQGLLGTPDGRLNRFSYFSCIGEQCKGRFSVEPCDKPSVATDRGPAQFRCE